MSHNPQLLWLTIFYKYLEEELLQDNHTYWLKTKHKSDLTSGLNMN